MITYPSTHGVFEEAIEEVCRVVHRHGGQVYMDGANMNAQVGLCRPGDMGADVCHLTCTRLFASLTAAVGREWGRSGVRSIWRHSCRPCRRAGGRGGTGHRRGVSCALGSASILPISYAYIAMMGGSGLTEATRGRHS